jgi:hypothetical protein
MAFYDDHGWAFSVKSGAAITPLAGMTRSALPVGQ